jgi:hypothetical protein
MNQPLFTPKQETEFEALLKRAEVSEQNLRQIVGQGQEMNTRHQQQLQQKPQTAK